MTQIILEVPSLYSAPCYDTRRPFNHFEFPMTIEIIPFERLLIAFIPTFFVIALMRYWGLAYGKACYSIIRMLLQLLLIGYALIMIFESESSLLTLAVLSVMILASSWISLNTLSDSTGNNALSTKGRFQLFSKALIAVFIGGGLMLALVTQLVLQLDPWYLPRYMIPLAGMIFATSMTSISLAGERLQAELRSGHVYETARNTAFNTAMIPNINAMFAVGLVSLPGMMTGQILSGVSPFIAARYQIMVMCMLFAAAGISSVIFMTLSRSLLDKKLESE
jgi:putative ABC transport system permease protein